MKKLLLIFLLCLCGAQALGVQEEPIKLEEIPIKIKLANDDIIEIPHHYRDYLGTVDNIISDCWTSSDESGTIPVHPFITREAINIVLGILAEVAEENFEIVDNFLKNKDIAPQQLINILNAATYLVMHWQENDKQQKLEDLIFPILAERLEKDFDAVKTLLINNTDAEQRYLIGKDYFIKHCAPTIESSQSDRCMNLEQILNTDPLLISIQDYLDAGLDFSKRYETYYANYSDLNLNNMRINFLNGINKIPHIEDVNVLFLNNNNINIREIPSIIAGLKNLKTLYLNNNNIKELPVQLGLADLIELSLDNNQITEIPKQLKGLEKLKRLSLNNNQITEIPVQLKGLENLTHLYLYNNQITEIPVKIEGLKKLTSLYLDNNNIRELPAQLKGLENLDIFYLNNNQIIHLPIRVKGLENLHDLYLGKKNPIAYRADRPGSIQVSNTRRANIWYQE